MAAPMQAGTQGGVNPRPLRGLRDEVRRTILRKAEERFRHELLEDDERQVLRDRILKLRRDLGLQAEANS